MGSGGFSISAGSGGLSLAAGSGGLSLAAGSGGLSLAAGSGGFSLAAGFSFLAAGASPVVVSGLWSTASVAVAQVQSLCGM